MTHTLTHELRFARLASGARLAWARSGRVGAPVLLRTAHWMTHVDADLKSPLWQPLIERLGQRLELVRYDERGCGLSGSDGVALGMEASIEEVDAVVCARGAERVALLGISGGAAAAIAYAARFPQRVSHLVLVAGYSEGLLQRNVTPDTRAYFEAQLQLIELGWGRQHAGVQQLFTSRFMPDGTAQQFAALNEHQRLSCDGARAAAIVRARSEQNVRHLLGQLQVPTLVLHCAGDLVVPLALGQELASEIEGARLEVLRSNNHIPLSQEPAFERLCEQITGFVAQAAAPAQFTPRQMELMHWVAKGCDNLQIAAHMGLSDKTVRNMTSALYAQLAVEGRAMAVVKARELGF